MKHLVIIGTGAGGRQVYSWAKHSAGYGTEWDIKGYIDGDAPGSEEDRSKLPLPVLGNSATYAIEENDVFVCSIGSPAVRKRVIGELVSRGAAFISIIHETSFIEDDVKIGSGVVIGPHSNVEQGTIVGNHVFSNPGCGIGHDVSIGDYTFLGGHVGIVGGGCVGEAVYCGVRSTILQNAPIGDNARIGAGSLVLRKVKAGVTVFGVPAEPIAGIIGS